MKKMETVTAFVYILVAYQQQVDDFCAAYLCDSDMVLGVGVSCYLVQSRDQRQEGDILIKY